MEGSKTRPKPIKRNSTLHKVVKKSNSNKTQKLLSQTNIKNRRLNRKRLKNIENSELRDGRWFLNEHMRLLKGILLYSNCWPKVRDVVRTRSTNQIRSHTQKYLLSIIRNSRSCQEIDPLRKVLLII